MMDRWAQGDTVGFVDIDAADITLFDDIAARRRIDGVAELRKYLASFQGKTLPTQYVVVDPQVRIDGDFAVLKFRYEPRSTDRNSFLRWQASSVYRRIAGEWRIVHAHWSIVEES
jgi:ketosteroid isomerase-like protein